jgi:uncharacterized protein with PQ loop repeat
MEILGYMARTVTTLSFYPVGSLTTHRGHAGYLMGLAWDDDHRIAAMAGLRVQYVNYPMIFFNLVGCLMFQALAIARHCFEQN